MAHQAQQHPYPPQQQPAQRSPRTGWIVLGAGAAIILASFLPWGSVTAPFVGTIAVSGVDGPDGWITAAVGALITAYGYAATRRRLPRVADVLAGLAGLAVAGVASWKIFELRQRVTDMRAELAADDDDVFGIGAAMAEAVQVRVGFGLWLLVAAGLGAAVAVGFALFKRS